MVGVTEASAAIGGIKAAIDIAKGIGSLKSEAERNQAVIEIQRSLLDAQNAAFDDKQTIAALVSKAEKLERQIQTATNWDVEKARYVLTKSELGAYTYDLKPEFSDSETLHRLCVTCFEEGKKSILHTTNKHSGGEQVTCGRCKNQLQLAKFVHQSIPNQNRGFYG